MPHELIRSDPGAIDFCVGGREKAQFRVLLPVPVGGQRDQAAKARFACAQGVLDVLALGDILSDAHTTQQRATGVPFQFSFLPDPADLLAHDNAMLAVEEHATADRCIPGIVYALAVLRRHAGKIRLATAGRTFGQTEDATGLGG